MANIVAVCEFNRDMIGDSRWQNDAFNFGLTIQCGQFESNSISHLRTLCHGGWNGFQPFNNAMVVPGAGLEPATFGCLRHHKGLCTSYDRLEGCPMSPTRYQLRHPGLSRG